MKQFIISLNYVTTNNIYSKNIDYFTLILESEHEA